MQCQVGELSGGTSYSINGFTLMLTIPVGPQELGVDYRNMLVDRLDSNLQNQDVILDAYSNRIGTISPLELHNTEFQTFFKLAVPKYIATELREADWSIEPDPGIVIYDFERPGKGDDLPYNILHCICQVVRQTPTRDQRPIGEFGTGVQEAYRDVVVGLFDNAPTTVDEHVVSNSNPELEEDLQFLIQLP